MAEITPLTGQATQSTQSPKIETPGTDNIAKTRSTETIAPEHDAVETVQASEESESNQVGGEEENRDTPESGSTFISTA